MNKARNLNLQTLVCIISLIVLFTRDQPSLVTLIAKIPALPILTQASTESPTSTHAPIVDQSAPSSWTPNDKLVAAYYFYWYNIYTGEHFITPDGSDYITNHPPDSYLANYSYTEVSWHRRELLDMMTAHIDIVLPVYFGNEENFFWSKPGLQNLVSATQTLIGEGRTPPKIGMFFDTNALLQQNNGIPPDLTTETGKAHFYTMISDFFGMVPNSLWATINSRPIIFLYSSSIVGVYNQSTFDYINQHFQSDFGTTPYFVMDTSWQGVSMDEAYSWGSALYGPTTNGRVGTLGPGFDSTALDNYLGQPPSIRDRECGEFYNFGWEAMMSAGATLIVIETWNELHEATEIAASREYGTKYLTLTAENVLRWKAADFGSAGFIWLDFGEHPYQQGLQPAFNFPDGAWLVTRLAGREAAYPDVTTTPTSHFIYLDVNNAFAHATPSDVWVTVEYFDGGTDQWSFQYDSVSNPYAPSESVELQNTGQWKRHTFHLTDAYFGGREAGGADLRLTDNYWVDGLINYFGRIWISKSALDNQAPDLAELNDVELMVGQVSEIPVSTTDPDGDPILLTLERAIDFVTLTDNGDGTGTLRLAPTRSDLQPCPFPIRIIATDTGNPALTDAVSLQVKILTNEYTLTITSAHGTVAKNPDKTTYHEGDVVQLFARPNTGWAFAKWTGRLTGTANPGFVTIHGNTSVTANYTKILALTFNSTASNDGWTLESSEFSNVASTKSASGTLRVGDDARNRQYRSLLYFDTSSLPNNAVVTKVLVQIKKAGITGDDPFITHGNLVADMKKGFFGLNKLLELSDFQAAGTPINTAKFTEIIDLLNPNWYQLTLSPVNFKYVNLIGVTQFRLRFTKDDNNDRNADFISFYAGDAAIANQPQLIIEYYAP